MTEAQFHAQVTELAQWLGWHVQHYRDSRQAHAGWPDLMLVGHGVFACVELKTDSGRLSPAQVERLAQIATTQVPVMVWRPRDIEAIELYLRNPERPPNAL